MSELSSHLPASGTSIRSSVAPSWTSIVVAAARALGSREPDESVRNPDLLADDLIGSDELDLISTHPISKALRQDYFTAIQDPPSVLLAWLMLLRTRFIDEALERAVNDGTKQIVILGAGFDSRAFRFRRLLRHCRVIELDAGTTQEYKKRRVTSTLGRIPDNLTYYSVDLTRQSLHDALTAVSHTRHQRTFYIWEGVSMYLTEEGVRQTLSTLASRSAPGSSVVLDYANRRGIVSEVAYPRLSFEMARLCGEPMRFGVPDEDGRVFFRELGFVPNIIAATSDPQVARRYTLSRRGVIYGAHIFRRLLAEARHRAESESLAARTDVPLYVYEARPGNTYWLAELMIPCPGSL